MQLFCYAFYSSFKIILYSYDFHPPENQPLHIKKSDLEIIAVSRNGNIIQFRTFCCHHFPTVTNCKN